MSIPAELSPPFTVDPPSPRTTRPADCYDVIGGDTLPVVASVRFETAEWIAQALNEKAGW